MIDALKVEISLIRDGRYNSLWQARKAPRIFRDSIACLNAGLPSKQQPCLHCFLMQFVPPEHREEEEPCHYIPLNRRGETVASLEAQGDRDNLEAALLSWLYSTVARLEKEAAQEESRPPASSVSADTRTRQ